MNLILWNGYLIELDNPLLWVLFLFTFDSVILLFVLNWSASIDLSILIFILIVVPNQTSSVSFSSVIHNYFILY